DRRVPVESKLLLVTRLRLDVARGARPAVDPPDVAALRFRIPRLGVGRIDERPETIAPVQVFPPRVRDAARVRRVADPRAVVLQPAVDLVRILCVETHMVELRDRQDGLLSPAVALC